METRQTLGTCPELEPHKRSISLRRNPEHGSPEEVHPEGTGSRLSPGPSAEACCGSERDGDIWVISSVPPLAVTLGRMSVILGTPPPGSVHMAVLLLDWPCHQTHRGRDRSQIGVEEGEAGRFQRDEGPGKELGEGTSSRKGGRDRAGDLSPSPRLEMPHKRQGTRQTPQVAS